MGIVVYILGFAVPVLALLVALHLYRTLPATNTRVLLASAVVMLLAASAQLISIIAGMSLMPEAGSAGMRLLSMTSGYTYWFWSLAEIVYFIALFLAIGRSLPSQQMDASAAEPAS